MSFISITINHIRAVQAWAEAQGAQTSLDLVSFELEIKARHRYYTLQPQFLSVTDGRFAHTRKLTPEVTGFIGWLPYRSQRWPLSSDKLMFKRLLNEAGVRTPAHCANPLEANTDYILKQSTGSFGANLAGPFRRGEAPAGVQARSLSGAGDKVQVFAEQFVHGRNLKAWFWGHRPFHAQLHEYPLVVGDGRSTVRQLATDRLQRVGLDFDKHHELPFFVQSLAYQGCRLEDVLAAGEQRWLDFRYGRRFCAVETTESADNALPRMNQQQRAQLDAMGSLIAGELARTLAAPVLFSVDGVVDDEGEIWWLEANSNPIFPPTGYPFMFETLFGPSVPAIVSSASGAPKAQGMTPTGARA